MDNIDFLTKVLMSEEEYWIVAKSNHLYSHARSEELPDSIMYILIPSEIRRGLKEEEILLTDIKKLNNSVINCNIFLNGHYAPFQLGQSFCPIYGGFPVPNHQKQVLLESLALYSDNICDYKNIIDKYEKKN